MKKFISTILISGTVLFASTYYSKLEPVHSFTIKSDVAGKVIFSDTDKEATFVKNASIVKLDDELNKINLASVTKKIELLKRTLEISKQNLQNLKQIEQIKKKRFEKYLTLSTKSAFDKENEQMNYIAAKNQTLSMEQSIENIKTQINDLEFQKASLKDTIEKKEISVSDLYINKVSVKEGDFIGVGSPVLEAYDISKGKLTIFLSKEDAQNLANLHFYLDGTLVQNPTYKVWKVADSQNISAYRCEIEVGGVDRFSKLVKIELKP